MNVLHFGFFLLEKMYFYFSKSNDFLYFVKNAGTGSQPIASRLSLDLYSFLILTVLFLAAGKLFSHCEVSLVRRGAGVSLCLFKRLLMPLHFCVLSRSP